MSVSLPYIWLHVKCFHGEVPVLSLQVLHVSQSECLLSPPEQREGTICADLGRGAIPKVQRGQVHH